MRRLSFVLLSVLLLGSGSFTLNDAAPSVPPKSVTAPPKTGSGAQAAAAPGFCIFGGWSGKPFDSAAAFKTVIWKSDVVYVGETHDQVNDHLAQLEALKAMREARGSKIVVGFEMLNVTLQPVLDNYAAGKLTEEEFLQKTDWTNEWGFDFSLYKPVFNFIIANRLKALALNVPKAVVSKIARTGLEGLAPEEKQYLPEKVAVSKNKKHLDYLKKAFADDKTMPQTSKFENYLAAMSAWNEAMGARLADFLNRNPEYSALVLAGNGHLMYNAGMPASVKARTTKLRQASFYTKDAAHCPAKMPDDAKDTANYVWYITHPKRLVPSVLQETGDSALFSK